MRHMLGQIRELVCQPVTAGILSAFTLLGLYAMERTPASMPFVVFIVAIIALLFFVLSRRAYFSLYAGLAIVSVIAVASTVKYKLKGFDLHIFDFAFTGGDPSAIWFLLKGYWMFIVPVVALIALVAIFLTLVARRDQPRKVKFAARLGLLAAMIPGLYLTYPSPPDEPRYFYYLGGFDASSFFVSLMDLQYVFSQGEFADKMRKIPRQTPYPDTVDCGDKTKLPDVVLVLSESTTDFKNMPGLKTGSAFDGDFLSQDGKVHPLYVETFGGGTWVTSISVMTGLSSVDFGVQAPYLTTVLHKKVRGALPEVLSRCGYRTVEITPVDRTFVNEGPFMESIGYQTVLDYHAIGATQYAHPDSFYYGVAQKVLREHHEKYKGPILLSMKTMFTHSPYFEPLAEDNGLHETPFSGNQQVDEYLNRVISSQRDFKDFLAGVEEGSRANGTVVLEFGDHQALVTRPFADDVFGGNALVDLRSVAYKTYYSVHAFGYDLDWSAFPETPIDVPFLGAALIKGAKLPTSPMYRDLTSLNELCQGRFHDCKDRAAIDRFLRKRVDSGLLNVLPELNAKPSGQLVGQSLN